MNNKKICGACASWESGDFWGTSSGNHGVFVESKGWCLSKKDKNGDIVKRKRWNYCPACKNFCKRKENGFFYQGGGNHTIQEDLANIGELMQELAEDNQ